MASPPHPPTLNRSARGPLARALRFKWAAFSAAVIFAAVYWIDALLVHYGLRPEATFLDDFLLSALVFGLGIAQQLRHDHELARHRELMEIVADVNHHTRNALQVIVGRSLLSMADSAAVEEIRQAVGRIDWCLREVLPKAEEPAVGSTASASLPNNRVLRSHRPSR